MTKSFFVFSILLFLTWLACLAFFFGYDNSSGQGEIMWGGPAWNIHPRPVLAGKKAAKVISETPAQFVQNCWSNGWDIVGRLALRGLMALCWALIPAYLLWRLAVCIGELCPPNPSRPVLHKGFSAAPPAYKNPTTA